MSAPSLPVLEASLDDYFECTEPRGKATIKFRACLERQRKIWKVPSTKELRPAFEYCARQCHTGKTVAATFPGGATAAVTPPANLRLIPQYRRAPDIAPAASAPASTRVNHERMPDPPLVPPASRLGVRGTARSSAKDEEERHAASAGKASVTPVPDPAVTTTPAPAPALRMTAEQVEASLRGVMTELKCRCGCGLPLRKNNRTGWRGEHNAARYRAGERPPRDQSKHPKENEMQRKAKPCCGSKGPRHLAACKGEAPPPAPASVPDRDFAGKSVDELVALRNRVTAELHRLQVEAEENAQKIRKVLGSAA